MVFGFKVHTNTKLDQREILFFMVKTAAFPIMTVPADEFEFEVEFEFEFMQCATCPRCEPPVKAQS